MRPSQHSMKNPVFSIFSRLTIKVFQPPYAGIPIVVLAYVFVLWLIFRYNGPYTGHLVGFDDHVRMLQVLNLINGSGWYDRIITRVNAPEGFETIWTRIVDIPIALTVLVGQIFTDQRTAALAASVVLPFAELILLFFDMRYTARPLVGKSEAWLVILFVMMTSILNHQNYTLSGFLIGQASHHAWYIILNVLLIGTTVRIVIGVPGKKPDWILAIAISLFLAVGIEGFPLIASVAALIGFLAWMYNLPYLAKRGAIAIGCGALLTALLLPLHLPPDRLFDVFFTQPSIMGPVLTGIAATLLIAESHILRFCGPRKFLTFILIGACTALAVYLIVFCFPKILEGPAAGLSPLERQLAAHEHPEAQLMYYATQAGSQYIGLTVFSLLAVVTGLVSVFKTTNRRKRMLRITYSGFALFDGAMAQIFWRYVHHAMMSACPLILFLWQGFRRLFNKNKFYLIKSFIVFFVLGPTCLIVLPGWEANIPLWKQLILYPAKTYMEPFPCEPLSITSYLNSHYDDKTNLNVTDNQSAYFLYYTHLKIDFLANYPSHDKFLDNTSFFYSQDLEHAREIARRHNFDLVATCRYMPMAPEVYASRPYRQPMMFERLSENNPPVWLKQVPLNFPTDFVLFEVDKNALKENTSSHE